MNKMGRDKVGKCKTYVRREGPNWAVNIWSFNVDREYSAYLMISRHNFSSYWRDCEGGGDTCTFFQICAFICLPIARANREEGLNDVPLLMYTRSFFRLLKEFCETTYAREDSWAVDRSSAIFRNPSVSFVISVIPQPRGQDVENFSCR